MRLVAWWRRLDKVSLTIEAFLIGGIALQLAGFVYIVYLFKIGEFGPSID